MTTIRSLMWATVTAALAALIVWDPRPAAGQQSVPSTAPPGAGRSSGPAAPPGATTFGGFAPQYVPATSTQESTAIKQLAQQYAKATKDDEKKDIRKKLFEALGQQFDELAEQQQKELEDLEKQVTALKALLKKRHDARDAIIDRRLEQVIQDAEGLGWGTHQPGPRGNSFAPRTIYEPVANPGLQRR